MECPFKSKSLVFYQLDTSKDSSSVSGGQNGANYGGGGPSVKMVLRLVSP